MEPELKTESKMNVIARRVVTISLLFLIFALYTFIFFPLAIACGILDLSSKGSKKWPRFRCILFFMLYLSCEIIGVLCAFCIWLFWGAGFWRSDQRFITVNKTLQKFWSKSLLRGAIKIFSMKMSDHGSECTIPGLFVLLVRHSSIADTVLPANLIANRYGILLRYVLKKELLWDPCLDIVGNRLPNVFIKRNSHNSTKELLAIKQLASNIGSHDGLLIYPEGTRFSPRKQQRILKRLKDKGKLELYECAKSYKHVLPPRPKGLKALLEVNKDLDVIVCAHTGFEGSANFMSFWQGNLIGKKININFWRISRKEIPIENKAYINWLYDLWSEVDGWIDQYSNKS